jgi:hypothetical protein
LSAYRVASLCVAERMLVTEAYLIDGFCSLK